MRQLYAPLNDRSGPPVPAMQHDAVQNRSDPGLLPIASDAPGPRPLPPALRGADSARSLLRARQRRRGVPSMRKRRDAPRGTLHPLTIDSTVLRSNRLGDPTERELPIYLPAGQDG